MRIGIDVRYLSHGLMGGVHTYIKNFVPTLIELAAEHQIYLYADTKRKFELSSLPKNVTLRRLPYCSPLSSIVLDFGIKHVMAHDRLDVVHFPANYGFAPSHIPTIITLHDTINILPWHEIVRGHPKNLRTIAMMTYLHNCTCAALPRADWILTVSEFAREDIARTVHIDPQYIVAVPHAPTLDMQQMDANSARAEVHSVLSMTKPFVIADALKNPGVLVQAWQLLDANLRNRYDIVFFARTSQVPQAVHHAVRNGYARLIVRPPRSTLAALYNLSQAFVFPSWMEGFGLPVLEAMQCGTPVIASNRGAIPEVAGNAALVCDADDATALARNIAKVLESPAEAQRLRECGFARVAQFSWKRTANEIFQVYRCADQDHPQTAFQSHKFAWE